MLARGDALLGAKVADSSDPMTYFYSGPKSPIEQVSADFSNRLIGTAIRLKMEPGSAYQRSPSPSATYPPRFLRCQGSVSFPANESRPFADL